MVVSKEYLSSEDTVLIVDDFLANGSALRALRNLCIEAGAKVAGAGIAIEKAYQGGGDELRAEGMRIESMARIASMDAEDGIRFC
jgi:xanthine phosphoribosyltransferase